MISGTLRQVVWIALTLLVLAGCANPRRAPVVEGSASAIATSSRPTKPRPGPAHADAEIVPTAYRVKAGDKLYAIAWRFGLDPRQIIEWNHLSNPDRIFIGQTLTLVPPAGVKGGTTVQAIPHVPDAPAVLQRAEIETVGRMPARSTAQGVASKSAPAATSLNDDLDWRWPAEGAVSRSVSASGAEGLDIRGQRGAPVVAAAAGKVVYSGSGLRGYGQLIIIKHNDTFLSAYAHNDQLLVAEGASVQAGQKIAGMGDSEAKEVMLHFEIRRNGKAVEPSQYLPKR